MASISTLGTYLDQISRLKTQQSSMADLTLQLSSGKKTQKLSGLGMDITKTMRARTGIDSLSVYNDNITNADRRMKQMDTAIREIRAQTENISSFIATATQQGEYPDLQSIQKLTDSVYGFITNLINQTDGERYLFGGADQTEAPLGSDGFFKSALGSFLPDSTDLTNPPVVASGLIGDWGDGTITTDQFIASYKSINDTTLGFSEALTTGTAGKTVVRVDDSSEFDYTVLANSTAMKDIIRTLGVLRALPPVEHAPGALNDPTATTLATDVAPFPPAEKQEAFFKVLNDLSATLNKATDGLEKEEKNLAQIRSQIAIVKTSHSDQIAAFKDIVADVENSDITEVSVQIKQLEIQLQASFQVTSILSQLTLSNFLQ